MKIYLMRLVMYSSKHENKFLNVQVLMMMGYCHAKTLTLLSWRSRYPTDAASPQALPFFLAFTGCENGKKTALRRWETIGDEVADAMITLTKLPESFSIYCSEMTMMEKFTIAMYSPTLNSQSVNEAARYYFPIAYDR